MEEEPIAEGEKDGGEGVRWNFHQLAAGDSILDPGAQLRAPPLHAGREGFADLRLGKHGRPHVSPNLHTAGVLASSKDSPGVVAEPVPAAVDLLLELLHQLVESMAVILEQRQQQVALLREVAVEGTLAESCFHTDVIDRHVAEAHPGGTAPGRVEYLAVALALPLLADARHNVGILKPTGQSF